MGTSPTLTFHHFDLSSCTVTYTHGAVGQIPGIAAVSIGSNHHPNSPFSFANVCENVGNPTPSTTYALQGLMRSPNGFRSTSRCGQSVQDMNVLSPGLELVCFSSLTGPQGERVVQQAGTYGAPTVRRQLIFSDTRIVFVAHVHTSFIKLLPSPAKPDLEHGRGGRPRWHRDVWSDPFKHVELSLDDTIQPTQQYWSFWHFSVE